MRSKTVKLTDLFEPKRGKSEYTKAYGDKHKGDYPVFSASNNTPLTHIDHYDYEGEYLSWSTNGFGGFVKILKGKFSVNGDRGILLPKGETKLTPEFIQVALEPVLRGHAKGRKGDKDKNEFTKVPLSMIKNVELEIPIMNSGDFDLELQKKIVQRYTILKNIKESILSEIDEISKITFDVDISKEVIIFKVEDIFDLEQSTNHSSFTKEFIDKNKGDIPVYSASKNPGGIGYGYVKDNLPKVRYFENILTWNIDGSVGKAFFRKGRFSLSEKVIPLILKEKWIGVIDYTFAKYVLEGKAIEKRFAFSNKAGKSKIKDIVIEVPSKNRDGIIVPDIDEQKKISKKCEMLENIKSDILDRLIELSLIDKFKDIIIVSESIPTTHKTQ